MHSTCLGIYLPFLLQEKMEQQQIMSLLFFSPLLFSSVLVLAVNNCTTHHQKCGGFDIPFPFQLDDSCPVLDAFRLSCLNNTTLFLNIGSLSYQIFEFFADGVLVDFPRGGATSCAHYFAFDSFGFQGNPFYGISIQNVLGLYDCEDSSVCKDVDYCDEIKLPHPSCQNNATSSSSPSSTTCCHPLSEHSVWEIGDALSVFSEFGCRGFSSWIVLPGAKSGKRGVKLEWAIPKDSSKDLCSTNAFIVNATAVKSGVRCECDNGFVGDGFVNGVGCLHSCIKDGRDCNVRRHSNKKVPILAGIIALVFILASLAMLLALLKRPEKLKSDTHPAFHQSIISYCKAQLFKYEDLEEATEGFGKGRKLSDGSSGTVHSGILGNGSHVAVQKIQCEDEQSVAMVLSRVELLSLVSHRNLACLLGCCMDSSYTALVVYEFYANGTLADHLQQKGGLDWHQRLHIAAETASVLAYLQYDISPPTYHHDLKSTNIFLDKDFSAKISCFGLLNSGIEDGIYKRCNSNRMSFNRSDVYDLGVLLLEIISGSKHVDLPTMALPKIRSGKLEEIVDAGLYYHEQPAFRREQIEIVADLATRCLLFGGDGRLGMMDAARELVQVAKGGLDGGSRRGPALEETFSNCSLLQMMSMSPDSIHLP